MIRCETNNNNSEGETPRPIGEDEGEMEKGHRRMMAAAALKKTPSGAGEKNGKQFKKEVPPTGAGRGVPGPWRRCPNQDQHGGG